MATAFTLCCNEDDDDYFVRVGITSLAYVSDDCIAYNHLVVVASLQTDNN